MRGRHSAVVAILLGGTIAGLVDIGAASAINGFINPYGIVKFIAAGLIGLAAARAGGPEIAVLGTVLQIAMSLVIATIYVVASNVLPALKRYWLPAGLAFGVGVFIIMTYVVVPLSALHSGMPEFTMKQALNLVAMLVFGTIIAWFARAAR